MSESLPFMNSTGLVTKILDKIIEAKTPDRFTQDFQSTVLGYGSGSAKAFIPLMKKIGLLNSDGTPTDLYKEFRSANSRGKAMAQAIKRGYAPLYQVNEYAHKLDKQKLKDAVIRVTGLEKGASRLKAIVGTFEVLKPYADFEQINNEITEEDDGVLQESHKETAIKPPSLPPRELREETRNMNLSYTINLNLPASKDPEVFDAIFKSLKENLLG